MEKVAEACLRTGDVSSASQLYNTLENLNPRYSRMARLCRVLCDPNSVPLPHRHLDVCEALLDPHFTAEILVGDNLFTEAVQKKYQRLVILVHPDKNPNPQAKDAFLRLANMREEAKDCLYQKLQEKAMRERREEEERMTSEKKRRKNGVSTDDDSVIPSLSELKNQKITLKSLKRKEIEDNFEIFTTVDGKRRRYNPFDVDQCEDLAGAKQRSTRRRKGAQKPMSKKKVDLEKALEEARQYLKEEEEALRKQEEESQRAAAEEASREAEEDPLSLIRAHLTKMIDGLQERRHQHLELHSDLSYDAYRREKKMGPKPQAFVVVPLKKDEGEGMSESAGGK